jgi:threonine synthase
LVQKGIIRPDETVVGILTGHVLKDAEAVVQYHNNSLAGIEAHYPNHLHQSEPTIESLSKILGTHQLA